MTYEMLRMEESRQLVTSRANGPAETFGTRYIFAHVDLSEVSAQLRLNYTFTPDFTLETYVEPFASSGRYHRFGELSAAPARSLLEYGTDGAAITRNEADHRRETLATPDILRRRERLIHRDGYKWPSSRSSSLLAAS